MKLIESTPYEGLVLKAAVDLLHLGEVHPDLPRRVVSLASELGVKFDSEVFHYITDMDVAVDDGVSFISLWPGESRVAVFNGETRERGAVVVRNGRIRGEKTETFSECLKK